MTTIKVMLHHIDNGGGKELLASIPENGKNKYYFGRQTCGDHQCYKFVKNMRCAAQNSLNIRQQINQLIKTMIIISLYTLDTGVIYNFTRLIIILEMLCLILG